jgi:hypothetical protein
MLIRWRDLTSWASAERSRNLCWGPRGRVSIGFDKRPWAVPWPPAADSHADQDAQHRVSIYRRLNWSAGTTDSTLRFGQSDRRMFATQLPTPHALEIFF